MVIARHPSGSVRAPAIAGLVLFGAAAAWWVVAGAAADASPAPVVALIVASGLAVGLGWAIASRLAAVVPAAAVGVAVVLIVRDTDTAFGSGPLSGPFGYANATGAFFAQAAIAAVMLVVGAKAEIVRVAGALAAILFGSVVVASRSWTAIAMVPVVLVIALVVDRTRGPRAAAIAACALFLLVLLGTLALGARGVGTGPIDRVVGRTLSDERVALWHEALAITADEPLLGVGPGRFDTTSPTAISDRDLRWAHHEFLQSGAESGLPGFALIFGLFAWGFAALWLLPGLLTAVAAAGLAVLGMHASVDYVLHFPAVPLIGAALVGAGIGARAERRESPPALVTRTLVREPI